MTVKDRGRVDEYYANLAKKEGYPARSVYKLKELDQKRGILRPGQRVLDLGSSPGSWSLYAAERASLVVWVDLSEPAVRERPGLRFLRLDISEPPPPEVLELSPFQVVLSDLAPRTTGQKAADSQRSLDLARSALAWASLLLERGGTFVFKAFQGAGLDVFLRDEVRPLFARAELKRPRAVRKQSPEVYAVCQGFAGPPGGG